ncbi:MAG: phosphatidylserine decarboxylase [Cirrosporium novae-zelandiae]|nr:MAG: phosphatidylserine decarboxylase [Cirrosporium novae-zelandiae]
MVRLGLPSRLRSSNTLSQSSSRPTSRAQSRIHSRANSPRPLTMDKSLVLRIAVLKARNLAAKDRGGTSDPYLVVTLGETRQSTSAIPKNLNPEWNETFDLPINGVPLLECFCWDKDRFGKDYLGELDIPLEDIFANGNIKQEPRWYPLRSARKKSKKNDVSGEVLLQFQLVDSSNEAATPEQILSRFNSIVVSSPEEDGDESGFDLGDLDDDELEDKEGISEVSSETDDPTKPDSKERKKRRLRLARLKKRSRKRAYEFLNGGSDVVGIVFLEISSVKDLPPQKNMTRTSFDMDPFVIASLGKKTFRTRVLRHNLNPVFDEKMVFQVLRHEQSYSLSFTVVDRDKLSGNDFIGQNTFPLQTLIAAAPEADPNTGLYRLPDPDSTAPPTPSPSNRSRFRLPLSRSASATSLSKSTKEKPKLVESYSNSSQLTTLTAPTSIPADQISITSSQDPAGGNDEAPTNQSDSDLKVYTIPVTLKSKERWEDKHSPELTIKAKYLPYTALRQQFWRAMLKQYDADDSARVSKVELTTMLDTLGSTLKESTINGFFSRFAEENGGEAGTEDLTFDQAVICLEDQLQQASQKKSLGSKLKAQLPTGNSLRPGSDSGASTPKPETIVIAPTNMQSNISIPTISQEDLGQKGEAGDVLDGDELADGTGEEHVVEIRECPLCHQPRLNKRSDADIITHIATCASQDWRQVNNIVMGGFVTSSQAQRKWYSKVITKISYGGYKLGANSANILVQDRITGQINEERMSVYVRLGIRLLYKGLKSRDMEKKRIRKLLKSLSIKQGKKYDDPASAREIEPFIAFHQLDMSEVLLATEQFKNFNEFFYRALKPNARPCSAPDNPRIVVSPADCRSVVFNHIDDATRIWIKGREFSIDHLLGKGYPDDVKRYINGSLGIFRLAPQDYHRFHIPVDGVLDEPKLIEGEYYTVNPMAIRSALDVYGENVRVLVPIDSVAHGRVMVICVGAMMVGSTVITRKAGEKVSRAEELGYFKFGGSTIILLFEPGVMQFDEDLIDNSNGALETLIRVGMSIGHHPEEGQWTPDMPKDGSSITQEELQEAQRRIEGSLAPTRPPRPAESE